MPWLGYLDKILKSDIFVFLDDVQFKKNEWQNRNRIKTAQGPQWLTVPVSFHFPEKITEVKINNETNWKKNHNNAFITNYTKAKYSNDIVMLFSDVYGKDWEYLSELNIQVTLKLMGYLGIKTKTLRSSEMETTGTSTERLVSICRQLEADIYLSGAGGKDYLEENKFSEANIKVIFQEFKHPVYPQCFGEFISNLSAIDLLFNCGPDSRDILIR